ncbi:MAG: UDP-glucose 4-epimerase GalE [Candidatus Omnitrophica bacterium CG1_02_46_14]|nr:MAG: UDP-glucose 4-epimerase GalE [Candidatus Omnitrophica bacterium CG1_02_46_14]
MKVLVVGGAGYIGSHMVRILDQAKHTPIIFDNLSTGHKSFVPKGINFFKGDLKNKPDVEAVFKKYKIDAVMHFAASALVGESVADPMKYYENNVLACVNLLKVMQARKINLLIFSSTCAIFGEPVNLPMREDDPKSQVNPYGRSKWMIEMILRDLSAASDLRYVALRYFNACGAHPDAKAGEWHEPETHLIPNILKSLCGKLKELTIFGDDYDTPDGTCVRDYIHVHDLCRAHLLALEFLKKSLKSDTFNLGSGKGYSVKEIISMAEKVTGKKVPLKIGRRRPGDPARLIAGAEKAKKILGWKPEMDLEKIIQTAWKWERMH